MLLQEDGSRKQVNARKEKEMLGKVRNFMQSENAIGVVEMILILVVLISLVLIFKTQLTNLVNNIFKKIATNANSV